MQRNKQVSLTAPSDEAIKKDSEEGDSMKARDYLKAKTNDYSKVLYVRCDDKMFEKIEEERRAAGLSKNKFMLAAIEFFLDSMKTKKKRQA